MRRITEGPGRDIDLARRRNIAGDSVPIHVGGMSAFSAKPTFDPGPKRVKFVR